MLGAPFRLFLGPVRMVLAPVRLFLKLVALVLAAVLLYGAVTLGQVWLTSRSYDPRPAQAIVVMGAAQYDGTPSPDLRARLDQAARLFHQGYAPLVVVTGGKQPGDRYTEAEAGTRYLAARGVPTADVLQAGGMDSYENLAETATLLKARNDRRVLMVTDPFHEYRSMAIATGVGLTPFPTPTRASPISGWAAVPYFLKEAGDAGLGRIIGYHHLSEIHSALG